MTFEEAYARGRAEAEHEKAMESARERLAVFESSRLTERSDLAEMGMLRAQLAKHDAQTAATRGSEAA